MHALHQFLVYVVHIISSPLLPFTLVLPPNLIICLMSNNLCAILYIYIYMLERARHISLWLLLHPPVLVLRPILAPVYVGRFFSAYIVELFCLISTSYLRNKNSTLFLLIIMQHSWNLLSTADGVVERSSRRPPLFILTYAPPTTPIHLCFYAIFVIVIAHTSLQYVVASRYMLYTRCFAYDDDVRSLVVSDSVCSLCLM